MMNLNIVALREAWRDLWLTKNEAARYFIRRDYKGGLHPCVPQLMRAVEDGRVRTATSASGRTTYNAWDCVKNANIY